MLEILSGLNNFAVNRLNTLWSGLSEQSAADFQALEDLMSPIGNFRNYNNRLKERKSPIIPHFGKFCSIVYLPSPLYLSVSYIISDSFSPLGLLLRDFTYLAENKPFLEDGSVDLEVIRLFGKRIVSVENMRNGSYKLPTTVSHSSSSPSSSSFYSLSLLVLFIFSSTLF